MSAKKLKNYSGLYEEITSDVSPFYVYSETIQDRSALFDWHIKPHIHTHLYQFFFIETGSVQVDTTSGIQHLQAPSIIVIAPGTVHGFTFDPSVTGRIVTLADTFIEGLLRQATNILLLLKSFTVITEFKEPDAFSELIGLTINISKEASGKQHEKDFAVQSWVRLLAVKLFRLLETSDPVVGKLSVHEKYYHDFQNCIKANAPFSKSVAEYARALKITPVHLNRVCQAMAQKPASWLIQEHAVREAQKLLRYTSLTVSEIAQQLNFSAPGYFTRFFKKHTGVTPEAFRKR